MENEDKDVRLNPAFFVTREENRALKKRLEDTGVKQAFFVREAVLERLRKENYLPNPQM